MHREQPSFFAGDPNGCGLTSCCSARATGALRLSQKQSLLVPYKTLATRLGKTRLRTGCRAPFAKEKSRAAVVVVRPSLSAAVACGSEKYRTHSCCISAPASLLSHRELMARKARRRPPKRKRRRDPRGSRTPSTRRAWDLLKRLWKAASTGPSRVHEVATARFQAGPLTDLRACKLLGLKTFLTFLKSRRARRGHPSSRRITGDFDPRKPGFIRWLRGHRDYGLPLRMLRPARPERGAAAGRVSTHVAMGRAGRDADFL